MGHSQAQKAETRARILALASQEVRARGLDAVAIGRLMDRAGLTHGGFYGHFESRDALVAEALSKALDDGEAAALAARQGGGRGDAAGVVRGYLSRAHRDRAAEGCAVASLIGDAARADPEVRAALAAKMERYAARLADRAAHDAEHGDADLDAADLDAAWGAWAAMIGALQLARVFAGTPLSDRILAAGRKAALAALHCDA
ncbi:MAG: TetR/AcrR family transcriptional regulator [Hyphomonadaceae bacterium]|nr:TetR/AcrR family transcriptional regulator [Hyphomonadaceae bacterium]